MLNSVQNFYSFGELLVGDIICVHCWGVEMTGALDPWFKSVFWGLFGTFRFLFGVLIPLDYLKILPLLIVNLLKLRF
jgi:hypothetical protein